MLKSNIANNLRGIKVKFHNLITFNTDNDLKKVLNYKYSRQTYIKTI